MNGAMWRIGHGRRRLRPARGRRTGSGPPVRFANPRSGPITPAPGQDEGSIRLSGSGCVRCRPDGSRVHKLRAVNLMSRSRLTRPEDRARGARPGTSGHSFRASLIRVSAVPMSTGSLPRPFFAFGACSQARSRRSAHPPQSDPTADGSLHRRRRSSSDRAPLDTTLP